MAATGWQVPTSYDRLEDGATHRSADPAYGIRRLNGFIKEVLFTNAIREVHSRPIRIVDLACGRGGDIGRFSRAVGGSFEYVGVDVSANQIAAARAREKAGYWPPGVSTKWTVADAFDPKAVAEVASMANPSFNVVSIQMALHYAAESKERMSNALGNAAALCAPGGVLIITTTDWKHMIDYATLGSDAATEGDVCTVKILDWADKGEFGVKVRDIDAYKKNTESSGIIRGFSLFSTGAILAQGPRGRPGVSHRRALLPVIQRDDARPGLRAAHVDEHGRLPRRGD